MEIFMEPDGRNLGCQLFSSLKRKKMSGFRIIFQKLREVCDTARPKKLNTRTVIRQKILKNMTLFHVPVSEYLSFHQINYFDNIYENAINKNNNVS